MIDLFGVLHAAGLPVVEHDGWRARGHAGSFAPVGVLNHHTGAGSDRGLVDLCVVGRSDLAGPLCNVVLTRDGVLHVICGGVGWHAGTGDARVLADLRAGVPPRGDAAVVGRRAQDANGNGHLVGIEVCNDGEGEGYPQAQLDSLIGANAALLTALGRPAACAIHHREWTVRKDDMSWRGDLRGLIAARMASPASSSNVEPAPAPSPLPVPEELLMEPVLIQDASTGFVFVWVPSSGLLTFLNEPTLVDAAIAAGVRTGAEGRVFAAPHNWVVAMAPHMVNADFVRGSNGLV